ncbi:MAG: histidine triad nucleotide-binding protein [Candidatus Aureabacteria bacterium]|nr:histidine triad nucleotide-binding protein [Candidatus Auribacterota bacterium]
MNDCIFCKIIKGEIPSQKVYDSPTLLAFKDIHPVSPVHILIIPKKHIPSLSDAAAADQALLGEMLLAAKNIASEKELSDYRIIINNGRGSGQTVFHIHLHLLSGRLFTWPPG